MVALQKDRGSVTFVHIRTGEGALQVVHEVILIVEHDDQLLVVYTLKVHSLVGEASQFMLGTTKVLV